MNHRRHARYWRRFLLPGENVIHTFGVSWAYVTLFWLLPAAALLAAGVVVDAWIGLLGLMFVLLAVILLVPALYLAYFVHYAVTNQRTMVREGILYKHFVTVDYHSITDVTVRETLLERIFTRTGTIDVNTAGGDQVELKLRHVARPMNLRGDIYKHLNELTGQPGQGDHRVQLRVD
ncbi:MAG: PH domain-containing protein [bacterium]